MAKGAISFLGPKRTVVNNATAFMDADTSGTLVVAITVDRAGRVVSAEAQKKGATFKDSALYIGAVALAREYRFNTDPTAPDTQHGKIVWDFVKVEVAVPIAQEEYMLVEETGEDMKDAPLSYQIGDDDVPPPPPMEDPVYDLAAVQDQPQFPGGAVALNTYLGAKLKYPTDAMDAGVQGKVWVAFVVDRDGGVKDVELKRGVHASLDKEALRVVKAMPKWTPGKMNGKPVRTRYILPVNFKLQ